MANVLLWPAAIGACLTGCGAEVVALEPRGETVDIVTGEPRGCRIIKEVVATSEGDDVETSIRGARNDLRNRTAARGGEYAVLQTSTTSPKGTFYETVMTGLVVHCPTGHGAER